MSETMSRCEHGVYDAHGDQAYCTVCRPVLVPVETAKVKVIAGVSVGVFNNPAEEQDQTTELVKHEKSLSPKRQSEWFTEFNSWVKTQPHDLQIPLGS